MILMSNSSAAWWKPSAKTLLNKGAIICCGIENGRRSADHFMSVLFLHELVYKAYSRPLLQLNIYSAGKIHHFLCPFPKEVNKGHMLQGHMLQCHMLQSKIAQQSIICKLICNFIFLYTQKCF